MNLGGEAPLHDIQKLFGWFGGHGPRGTAGFFESLGYRWPYAGALVAGAAEAGGGLLLSLGLVTPAAAAAIVGVMLNAIVAVHLRNGLWVQNGGFEYPLVLCAAALATAFAGPGAFSLDSALGLDLSGPTWGLGALGLGVVAAFAALATRRAPVAAQAEERRAA
jgi:putative oxidoreductase